MDIQHTLSFLSGGLAGSVFTHISKKMSEQKKKKRLVLNSDYREYSLPFEEEHFKIPNSTLKISYDGAEYDSLHVYSLDAQNTGSIPIHDQKLIFTIPSKTNILKINESSKPVSISSTLKSKNLEHLTEYEIIIDILESGDIYSINFILNTEKIVDIKCYPRGVENIIYMISDKIDENQIKGIRYKQ